MPFYKNVAVQSKRFFGIEIQPGEVKQLPKPINDPKLVIVDPPKPAVKPKPVTAKAPAPVAKPAVEKAAATKNTIPSDKEVTKDHGKDHNQ